VIYILERNMKILSEYMPETYKQMQSPEASLTFTEQVMFGVNENQIVDNIIVKLDEKIMAVGAPDSEVWLTNVNPDLHTIIVFGLGMGYHVESLIKKYPDKKIIVIEPDKRIFYNAVQIRDFEFIIKNCTIWIDEPVDLVKAKMHELITHPLARGIMLLPYYGCIYQEYFNTLVDGIKRILNDWAVMVNTKKCLVDKWYTNRIINARKPSYDGKALINAHKGLPGIVVGAGPSLQTQLEKLKEIQGKVVMIAASTAMEILHSHGIRPTYAIAIDQDPVTSGGLHETLDSDVPLIYDTQIAQNSLNYRGPKIQVQLNVNRYTTHELPIFESGPSVANVALDVLHKMGCSPILLVGMDLSYTDNKLYCGGTKFNQDIKETNLLQMTNNKGETCFTEPSFVSMRNWYEEYVKRIKPDVYNCTERGLIISAIPNRSLDEFVFDKDVIMPEFALLEGAKDDNYKTELIEIKEFIEKNKAVNPAFQKYKAWVLIDEYVQSDIYIAEIRSEGRIKRGMDIKESVKIFQDQRINLILAAIDKLLALF